MNSIRLRFLLTCFSALAILTRLDAQCTSDAGTMNTSLIEACANESITAIANGDETLDADDVLQFFLHTNAGTSLGTVLSTNFSPEFSFDGGTMTYGVTYYISAVVGNNDGSGNVDLTDPCLSVAMGTPVLWIEVPTASLIGGNTVICSGIFQFLIPINLTGTAPWTLEYSFNGVPQPIITINSSQFSLPISSQSGVNTICLMSVSDANCTSGVVSGCLTIDFNPPISCDIAVTNVSCNGQNDGSATITCTGGTPPYLINWGGSGETWSGLAAGTYTVQVIDAVGCDIVTTFTITQAPAIFCAPTVSGSINCQNGEATVIMTCTGGGFPWEYTWDGPNNFVSTETNPTVTEPGDYFVTVTNSEGCSFIDTVTVVGNSLDCGTITGNVTSEEDGNCTLDAGEGGLNNWLVWATASNGDEYFDFTDIDGHYSMQAPPDDYTVEAIPPAAYWADCGGPISLTLEDASDIDTADFHWLKTINCPLMEVDISTTLLRRCQSSFYYVNYCNNGSEPAPNAYIEVTLDPLMTIQSASIPYVGPVNGVYTFELGDVAAGECGNFHFLAHVSCDAVLGQTLCAEAHVFPDSLCLPINPNWSGAFIEITSNCTADSVIFTITNTGTGDMTEPQGFIVVEDGVMLMTGDVQLVAGASTTVSVPANGSTYNILAEQVAGVPGYSNPSVFVEGCGMNSTGAFSTGYASQFPEDDDGPFISIDCHPVIGSYDPNDKTGYPLGYGNQHLIEVGQPLDYHIRFQNTGTDTAFLVKIQDVIDPSLDLTTLGPGASSHPYQLEIQQDTLVFIFENILLPDSNVNEPASHGFVKFNISQRAGLPLGTVIENEAAIFFDSNDPILTNKTAHKLGDHFIETALRKPVLPNQINCLVYPNPFANEAMVVLQGTENQEVELRLYDLTGRFLRSEKIKNGVVKIKRDGLPQGLYFYEILAKGAQLGQGKLAIE